jgi:hypothetical protein
VPALQVTPSAKDREEEHGVEEEEPDQHDPRDQYSVIVAHRTHCHQHDPDRSSELSHDVRFVRPGALLEVTNETGHIRMVFAPPSLSRAGISAPQARTHLDVVQPSAERHSMQLDGSVHTPMDRQMRGPLVSCSEPLTETPGTSLNRHEYQSGAL